jgi:AraC family transcriptional regulator
MRSAVMNRKIKDATRKEYLERINRVIDYINRNPTKKPSLSELSRIASFSEYHFHRVFQAMTGMSLFHYLQKIRLAHAAHKLLYRPDLSITDIAAESDFSSLSDFERSFKKHYHAAPLQYRNAKTEKELRLTARPAPTLLLAGLMERKIRLAALPPLRVAYILSTGLSKSFKNSRIADSYKKLYLWANSRGLIDGETLILGMYPDNPVITPLEECRYYACISVPDGAKPDGEIGVERLDSEGTYAVYPFNPKSPLFARRFFRVTGFPYGRWIPDHGYYPDDKPFLEVYNVADGKLASMDFCIPIRTL